jgi:hypothetical protein
MDYFSIGHFNNILTIFCHITNNLFMFIAVNNHLVEKKSYGQEKILPSHWPTSGSGNGGNHMTAGFSEIKATSNLHSQEFQMPAL